MRFCSNRRRSYAKLHMAEEIDTKDRETYSNGKDLIFRHPLSIDFQDFAQFRLVVADDDFAVYLDHWHAHLP